MKKLLLFVTLLLASYYVQSQIVNIPDANFKNALVNTNCVDSDGDNQGDIDVDTNNDGEIQQTEAEAVVFLLDVHNQGIFSLEGIASFVNLKQLSCGNNALTTLNLTSNSSLERLYCSFNSLTSIDVSQSPQLNRLVCNYSQITSLDLSQNVLLERVECINNQLTNIDLPKNSSLQRLFCFNNQLTQLDVTQSPNLIVLECDENQLTSMDVSQNPQLISLDCRNNQLTSLNLKNGNNGPSSDMDCRNNTELFCIQVDNVAVSQNRKCDVGTFGWCISPWMEYSVDCNLNVAEYASNIFRLYPNPANDILNLSSEEVIRFVSVYNFTGQLLFKANPESLTTKINTSGYTNGTYFVKLVINDNTYNHRFIKE